MIRHNWNRKEVLSLFSKSLPDLVFEAQTALRQYFDPNKVQFSTLLSIKTGGCADDCKYCPQSSEYDTGLKAEKMMDKEDILSKARLAKENGASRFCMGAAWRSPKDRHINQLTEIVKEVKSLGLETCMTLGMLTKSQANELAEAGLDYYNHNIDTSENYYKNIITTRTFQDRLDTLENVRESGMKVCCGGIIGMGENIMDRVDMLITLANLDPQPESVPINQLVKVAGTPLADSGAEGKFKVEENLDPFDFVKVIAVARIMMPASYVRLSAGREQMNEQMQALCLLAGANSIFYGEKLLTTSNPDANADVNLLAKLGYSQEERAEKICEVNLKESKNSDDANQVAA